MKTTAKQREQMRAYYAKNRERILAQKKTRRETAEGKLAKSKAAAKYFQKAKDAIRTKRKLRNFFSQSRLTPGRARLSYHQTRATRPVEL